MDKKIFVSGTTVEEYWDKVKDELNEAFVDYADEAMSIRRFMKDETYDSDAMNYLKFKAQERYEEVLCNQLVIDLSMAVLDIIHEVPTPTNLETDYQTYFKDICKAIKEKIK